MTLSNNGEIQVLDEIFNAGGGTFPSANVYVALFTGDPGETGASNEVTGGSYARQQADFAAAGSGTTSNAANIDFTGMPTVAAPGVVAWGIFDAVTVGNCFWTGWFSTVGRVAIMTTSGTTDIFTSDSHGFIADDRVVFEQIEGETMPAGPVAGTLYWVISSNLTTDGFQVSATQGGAALAITGDGPAMVRKVVGKTTNSGDTFRIASGDLDIYID